MCASVSPPSSSVAHIRRGEITELLLVRRGRRGVVRVAAPGFGDPQCAEGVGRVAFRPHADKKNINNQHIPRYLFIRAESRREQRQARLIHREEVSVHPRSPGSCHSPSCPKLTMTGSPGNTAGELFIPSPSATLRTMPHFLATVNIHFPSYA